MIDRAVLGSRDVLRNFLLGVAGLIMGATVGFSQPVAEVKLWQAANGGVGFPTSPAGWTQSALFAGNGHFLAGQSVAFRATLTNLAPGPHNLLLSWVTSTNGKVAYDFLTHYDRGLPHTNFLGHAQPELFDAVGDLGVALAGQTTFAIPMPATVGNPVPGQPAVSFGSLSPGERVMSIWNGHITNLTYLIEDVLTNNPAVSSLSVDFEAADTNVVIAWGAHIATATDWGEGNTASGPGGQTYVLRVLSLDGQNLGPGGAGLELTLSPDTVYSPPGCVITGGTNVCGATTNCFTVSTDATNATPVYGWHLTTNTADAVIIGDTNQPTVQVLVGTNGNFTLTVTVATAGVFSTAETTATVLTPPWSPPLPSPTVCPGVDVNLATTPSGTGPFSFVWRKDGLVIVDATNSDLTLTNVGAGAAGEYCLEITGACGAVTNCATLTIITPPPISCPSNLAVQCWGDIPLPDTNAVSTLPTASVLYLGDSVVTNACEFVITRTYAAVNTCNLTSICSQVVTVLDTTPPILVCATNRTVAAGDWWSFDPPAATDDCAGTNVTLAVLSTTTNSICGGTYAATRTWVGADVCGNTNTCSQMVTVVDETPPVVVAPPNRTVEYASPWEFGVPVAPENASGSGVVYDNSVNDLQTRFDPGTNEVGNEIVLAGIALYLQEFAFDFWSTNLTGASVLEGTNVTVRLRFYANDGTNFNGYPTPGTQLYDSGDYRLDIPTTPRAILGYSELDLWLYALQPLTGPLPQDFTWTVQFAGLGDNDRLGVDLFSPPVIGQSYGDYWLRTEAGWRLETNSVGSMDIAATAKGNTNHITVTVLNTVTNPACGNTFTAIRTWLATDNCGKTNLCSQTVVVVDTTPPTLVAGTNRTVECGSVWEFDTPLVFDASGPTNVALVIAATTTNNHCGNSFTAARTWLATDACGNSNLCSQTVEVVDTTPPSLVSGTNRTVECSVAWEFDPPFVWDACDPTNVTLVIVSSTTNQHCSSTFTAVRTWLATDACGNTNQCSQTVAVVDTTPPLIWCSSNIVVECVGPAGTPVNFSITAGDACNTNVLIYSLPPSGTAFTLGTNTVHAFAVDACHNTNTCSFTVTVLDRTPPSIVCPADIIAAESPRDSGSAPVIYAAPVVGDICDGALVPVTYPPSGFAFPVGTNTVNAMVTDDSGNTNACAFTVRVIPYRLYVTNNGDAGPGTLRQALLDANAAPGENLVLFNLPGAGIRSIALASPLPEITSPVILEGWSQPGFGNQPLVEVTGGYLPAPTNGLVISAGASTVRGLILNGFRTALTLTNFGTNVIQGNHIGTGTNTADGIYIACDHNLIGGTTNLAGNTITGNGGSGIHLDGVAAAFNLIQGNLIGVGTNGISPLGNGLDGIRLAQGATQNFIGAASPPGLNLIAYNHSNGVTLAATAGSQNSILANSIHHNVGLGIDLGNDGPTLNDPGDPDAGPNQLQNAPVLTDARADGGLVIEGTLNATPNASYRLDFWLNNTADPSTYGEGQFYLGSSTVSLNGSGTENFAVGFAVSAVYTQFVTAVATDLSGNSSEFSRAMQVRTPPVLEVVPVGTNSTSGGAVTLCASASGTTPIFYQWRLNGQNIPGATNACYTLTNVQTTNGGTYSVVVYNILGSSATAPAPLLVSVTNAVAAGDDFVDRVPLSGSSGLTAGSNANATRESGEPVHAGKPGGKSVWYTWKAKETGIMTIGTSGSDFDTLLGVYTGNKVTNLVVVASDEDGGGYFTSGVRFNVIEDRRYHLAIDGYGGEGGTFVFGWQFDETERLLPVITTQPQSQTVAPGSNATFTVAAVRQCKYGHLPCYDYHHFDHYDYDPFHYDPDHLPKLSVQWYFEGNPLPGQTNYSLVITNVADVHVGQYRAAVTITYELSDDDNYHLWGNHDHDHEHVLLRTVESAVADLQINITGFTYETVQARDKLADALLGNPWIIGGLPTTQSLQNAPPVYGLNAVSTVVSGFTGTQTFRTTGSTTSPAEDPICGVLGGASEWLSFVTSDTGYLFLNTDGSSYDTVIAAFLQLPSGALQYLACDNNSGANGKTSALTIPVQAGKAYALVVDGVNGASGTVQLNYGLASKITLKALAPVQDSPRLQIAGWAGMKFSIQTSTNLGTWTTIRTTTSATATYDFTDTNKVNTARFYRAKIEP